MINIAFEIKTDKMQIRGQLFFKRNILNVNIYGQFVCRTPKGEKKRETNKFPFSTISL